MHEADLSRGPFASAVAVAADQPNGEKESYQERKYVSHDQSERVREEEEREPSE
jgi:hypothetical protein